MRVLLDANVFISYLFSAQRTEKAGKIYAIVEAGFSGAYTIVYPEELIQEIRRTIAEKPQLVSITHDEVEELISLLSDVAEFLPTITEDIPVVTRDAKDDYLLAYALAGECEYLVSGDRDLLALKQVEKLQIVRPSEFFDILKKRSEDDENEIR